MAPANLLRRLCGTRASKKHLVATFCVLSIFYILQQSTSTSYLPTSSPSHPLEPVDPTTWKTTPNIPRRIWQIYFPPPEGDSHNQLRFVTSWKKNAPGYTYKRLGEDGGAEFVTANFGPEVVEVYQQLHNPALKSDFLRYLLLSVHGGYYSDLDTEPRRNLEDWIPAEYKAKARLIVAPEYDQWVISSSGWLHPMQFCQWTIAAAPGHPALKLMIERAITGLKDLAALQGTTIDKISASDKEVFNATGPPAWTEVVFQSIQNAAPEVTSYKNLSKIPEPRLFGDILLLPLDSFMTLSPEMRVLPGAGSHQLVHHEFSGAWKKPIG